MLTRSEAADPAVEELKRRARRRLVGAIVLALAAAVILPLLLESDPKPLGDDVSIQIPPIDNGKFITPLSPGKGPDRKALPDVGAAPAPATAPRPAAAPDSSVEAKPGGAAVAAAAVPNDKSAETRQAPAADVAAPPAASATGVISAGPEVQKLAAPASKGDAPPDVASPAGSLVVQLAAFSDAKAASALTSKLKSAGFPAYTETLQTQKGTVRRVRVGPYATRDVADAQVAKLKAAGYRGVVATK